MNIFVLDKDPKVAASYLIDKHVVKMVLETAQLLCAVISTSGVATPYKPTHLKHPCTIWAMSAIGNFDWLGQHGLAIASEYTKRYGKVHKSQAVIEWCINNRPQLPEGTTDFAQAMPEEFKSFDAIEAYRAYYKGAKMRLLKAGETLKF